MPYTRVEATRLQGTHFAHANTRLASFYRLMFDGGQSILRSDLVDQDFIHER